MKNIVPPMKPMLPPIPPAPPPRPTRSTRHYIHRDREGANERLVADYFFDEPRFPEDYFRRSFRMSKRLLHIVNTLSAHVEYFQSRRECDLCNSNMEQYCRAKILTYNHALGEETITQGGFSSAMIVHHRSITITLFVPLKISIFQF